MSPVSEQDVRVAECGPCALRVSAHLGDRERDWRVVHKLSHGLAEHREPGLIGSIPTYESVLVEFDPASTTVASVAAHVHRLLDEIDPDEPLEAAPRSFVVPVLYGGPWQSDLDEVASLTGLDPDEVIRRHLEPTYTVRCLGAPGGSPMLDGPALPIPVPRLPSPRASVPAGVVSLAGRQATIAPASAPGGWRVIGRTPLTILDLAREPLVPYRPGDALRFERVDEAAFERLAGRALTPEGAPS
jgi:KipI family sensor histidine kinase inhibitor